MRTIKATVTTKKTITTTETVTVQIPEGINNVDREIKDTLSSYLKMSDNGSILTEIHDSKTSIDNVRRTVLVLEDTNQEPLPIFGSDYDYEE